MRNTECMNPSLPRHAPKAIYRRLEKTKAPHSAAPARSNTNRDHNKCCPEHMVRFSARPHQARFTEKGGGLFGSKTAATKIA